MYGLLLISKFFFLVSIFCMVFSFPAFLFTHQVMTRIPAAYRTNTSSVELYLRLLGTHALHLRLGDLRYSSPLDALLTRLQHPLNVAVRILLVGSLRVLKTTETWTKKKHIHIFLPLQASLFVFSSHDVFSFILFNFLLLS